MCLYSLLELTPTRTIRLSVPDNQAKLVEVQIINKGTVIRKEHEALDLTRKTSAKFESATSLQ